MLVAIGPPGALSALAWPGPARLGVTKAMDAAATTTAAIVAGTLMMFASFCSPSTTRWTSWSVVKARNVTPVTAEDKTNPGMSPRL